MATTAVERVFVDTNVLVFATQATAPCHAEVNHTLTALHNGGAELWISRQVRNGLAPASPDFGSAPAPGVEEKPRMSPFPSQTMIDCSRLATMIGMVAAFQLHSKWRPRFISEVLRHARW